jgi:hypothetical protein
MPDVGFSRRMVRMIRLMMIVVVACIAASGTSAAQAPDPWSEFRYLLGNWEGVGKGAPGTGGGTFSFELALDGNVLIRRSHSEYPATKDRPATVHDDLMLVYPDGARTRAIYFDNEKHVIQYTVTMSSSPRTITFTSPVVSSAPRFRFIYRVIDADTVNNRFEMAPAGKPDAFALYVEGDAKRVK